MIVAMYWLLFFLTLETYFGVFSFKRKGKVNNGKKKNNVVKKIGDSASLLSKPKSILRRKDFKELVTLTKQNSAPGEWKTEIIEHSPSVPCGDEFNALQEILSSTPGVFWKPRKEKSISLIALIYANTRF